VRLAPTRFFEPVNGITFRAELSELSDWSLKDIGIFRQVPSLDALKPFWMARRFSTIMAAYGSGSAMRQLLAAKRWTEK
jgi:Domain of unknown function (DUF1127)